MKVISHIRRWNVWRKDCLNSSLYKLGVLLGVFHSPSFEFVVDVGQFKSGAKDGRKCIKSKDKI